MCVAFCKRGKRGDDWLSFRASVLRFVNGDLQAWRGLRNTGRVHPVEKGGEADRKSDETRIQPDRVPTKMQG
jgi:hypothetical protein